MLYNPDVRYKNRIYLDFNVQIKKIKLRDTLTKIMGAPDVYLRAKVPEDIYDTMQKFAEMRKLDRMTLVRDFDLFPLPERLLNLERKYGDSLSHQDLYGKRQKSRKKRSLIEEAGASTTLTGGWDQSLMLSTNMHQTSQSKNQATASLMSSSKQHGGSSSIMRTTVLSSDLKEANKT